MGKKKNCPNDKTYDNHNPYHHFNLNLQPLLSRTQYELTDVQGIYCLCCFIACSISSHIGVAGKQPGCYPKLILSYATMLPTKVAYSPI